MTARENPRKAAGKRNGESSSLAEIQAIYRFMVEQKLETLDYGHGDVQIRLVRQRQVPVPVPVPISISPQATPASAQQPLPSAPAQATLAPGALTVKAPMMGIFYRASSPSSPPFVKKADTVKKGQVLCLIEAMKVFNEVKADFDMTILELLLENGKPVKAGQPIYVVEKANA